MVHYVTNKIHLGIVRIKRYYPQPLQQLRISNAVEEILIWYRAIQVQIPSGWTL